MGCGQVGGGQVGDVVGGEWTGGVVWQVGGGQVGRGVDRSGGVAGEGWQVEWAGER